MAEWDFGFMEVYESIPKSTLVCIGKNAYDIISTIQDMCADDFESTNETNEDRAENGQQTHIEIET